MEKVYVWEAACQWNRFLIHVLNATRREIARTRSVSIPGAVLPYPPRSFRGSELNCVGVTAKSAALLAFVLVAFASCAKERDRGPAVHEGPRDPPPDASVIDTGVNDDAGFCGEEFLREVNNAPTLYFIVDRSGSMSEELPGSILSKYLASRATMAELLSSLGHRLRYGAAVFPPWRTSTGCEPGEEVFSTRLGDPPSYAAANELGPELRTLIDRLGSAVPEGGTPTAPTLQALAPMLRELGGDTSVVLLTDGAPNCNAELSCGPAECSLNIEGRTVNGISCSAGVNCCDSDQVGEGAESYCVDSDAAESAVKKLAEDGIRTYVVGMPGGESYADVLDRLALAGQTARDVPEGEPLYYGVSDEAALGAALREIATGIAISCTIELEAPPEHPSRVNVYFDGELVPLDAVDGWDWAADDFTHIEVFGAACERLGSGDVLEARAVFGCDTVLR